MAIPMLGLMQIIPMSCPTPLPCSCHVRKSSCTLHCFSIRFHIMNVSFCISHDSHRQHQQTPTPGLPSPPTQLGLLNATSMTPHPALHGVPGVLLGDLLVPVDAIILGVYCAVPVTVLPPDDLPRLCVVTVLVEMLRLCCVLCWC